MKNIIANKKLETINHITGYLLSQVNHYASVSRTLKKSGNNYSFLIPLKLNETSQGYLIANDENGNVKLREVVSFKSNDSDEIL